MATHPFIAARVSPELKLRVQQLAQAQLLTESIWLRQLVDAALRDAESGQSVEPQAKQAVSPKSRIYVRLRVEDQLLLRERAAARGMRAATYLSVLTRAYLRRLTPLPKAELLALKRSIAGAQCDRSESQSDRALRQQQRQWIAKDGGSANVPEGVSGTTRSCEGALIKANINSWEDGYVAGND